MAVKARPCVPLPGGVGPGAWVRAYGDWINNTQPATWGAFNQTLSNNVNYNQNIAGAQMGYDWAFLPTGHSAILVGLLGGADASTVNFASGTKVTFQGGDVGAYATFLNRGFFVDGLAMGNWMTMDYTSGAALNALGANLGVSTEMQQWGGRIDTGYRFQFNPWFFEPQLAAEVVHTGFDQALQFPSVDAIVNINDDTSVRGWLGGRVGTNWVWNGWRFEPSIFGGVWQTFLGTNAAILQTTGFPSFVLDLTDPNADKTLGEIGGMVNFYQIGNNVSAFVKGDYRWASEYTSGSVEGGVRYQWP